MSKLEKKLVGMIVEGRNLAAKDPNGLSDPFLTYGPVDKKGNWAFLEKKSKPIKSKVVRKTLQPVWRSTFEVLIDSNCKGFKVEVWDWDLIGTDFMGQVVIPLSDLTKGRECENWYKLLPRPSKKDVVSGEILVRIMYTQEAASGSLLSGSVISGSVSRRMGDLSSANPSMMGNTASISEDEYAAMDDMRSGEIDLMIPALMKFSESHAFQQIALPAFAKWAHVASVNERISLIEKYKESLFTTLAKAAEAFQNDARLVFYAIVSLSPLFRLVEAKPYWNTELSKLIAQSIKAPPADLNDSDKSRHITNCLVILANVCTSNLNSTLSNAEATRCEEVLLTSGALDAVLPFISNTNDESILKHALTLIVKIAHSNDNVKLTLQAAGFVKSIENILNTSKDPITLWIAVDALYKYASSDDKKYATEILEAKQLLSCLSNLLENQTPGIHGASIVTAIVYLLSALSQHWDASYPITANHTHIIKLLSSGAVSQYLTSIPKSEQKPLLAQRCLQILTKLSSDSGIQQLIVSDLEKTCANITECSKFQVVLDEAALFLASLIEKKVVNKSDIVAHFQKAMVALELEEQPKKMLEELLNKI